MKSPKEQMEHYLGETDGKAGQGLPFIAGAASELSNILEIVKKTVSNEREKAAIINAMAGRASEWAGVTFELSAQLLQEHGIRVDDESQPS